MNMNPFFSSLSFTGNVPIYPTSISFFTFFSCCAIISAIMVIICKNPIHAVLYLILVILNISCILITLNAEFLAALFLIVYVGAVAVLFLFVVMMLNIRVSEYKGSKTKILPLGLLTIIIIFLILIFQLDLEFNMGLLGNYYFSTYIPQGIVDLLVESHKQCWIYLQDSSRTIIEWNYLKNNVSPLEVLGGLIYTRYAPLFWTAGMILLVAMVGVIILTVRKKKNIKKQEIFKQVERKNSIIKLK